MAKYITKEDYYNARGIDLTIEFSNVATDNPSRVVDIVLQEIEDEFMDEFAIYDNANKTLDKEIMKKALIYQVDYLRENGNLSRDREYKGKVICPNAYRVLKNNGYANMPNASKRPYWGAY